MSKARDLANAGTALTSVSATELGYLDGVTSAVQTQINAQIPKSTVTTKGDLLVGTGSGTLVAQGVGADGQFLQAASAQADGVQWATVSQYALPSQTGNSGKFLTTNGTSESWGTVTLPPTFTQLNSVPKLITGSRVIETNGSNIIVVAGDSGELMSSTDSGATFTVRTSQFSTSYINDIAFGNGIFVAVGDAGKISSSTDGITWTARTANVSTNAIYAVTFANGTFVAVGAGASGGTGGITTSTDGITWTKRTTPSLSSDTLYSVAYGNGYWVAVGTVSTNAGYYSTDLATWSKLSTTLTGDMRYVNYNGSTGWYGFQNGQTWVTAAAPTGSWYTSGSATQVSSPQTTGYQPVVGAYNGKVYNLSTNFNNYAINVIGETYASYTVSNTRVINKYQPVIAPSVPGCLHISGNKLFIGDNDARIYSATLT